MLFVIRIGATVKIMRVGLSSGQYSVPYEYVHLSQLTSGQYCVSLKERTSLTANSGRAQCV